MLTLNSRIKNPYFKLLKKQQMPTSKLSKCKVKPILKHTSK